MRAAPASNPRRTGALVAGAGLVLLSPPPSLSATGRWGREESVFRAVNDLPEWLYRPLWLFQQFGNIVVAILVVLGIAILLRSRRLASPLSSALWPSWPSSGW